jgi:hypothetical protein
MFALAKLHDIVAALRPSLFSGINAGFSIIAVNTFLVLLLSAGIYTATKFILFEEVRGYFPFSRKAP